MNPPLEELATLYVLDRLEPGERTGFETSLLASPELAAQVRELETALARRIGELPRQAPPADLLARIESRLDRLSVAPADRAHPVAWSWTAAARWGIAAVIALSVATLAVQSLRGPSPAAAPVVLIVGLGSHASTFTELPLPAGPRNAEASFVQLATLAEKYWDHPAQLSLTPSTSSPSAHGYALFDPGSHQGFIAFRQLPVLAPGHQYYLWVVDTTSGQVSAAGVLPATDAASGLYSFSVAPTSAAPRTRMSVFVTAEDISAAGAAQPRGKVVLGSRQL